MPGRSSALEVLLIDDDELLCAQLDRLLTSAGIGSLSVTSIEAARAAMEAVYFPLVIIDRQLGDDDGIDLCREYRAKYAQQVRILIFSGTAEAERDVNEGIAAGADAYLSKRCTEAQLLERVQQLLQSVRSTVARTRSRGGEPSES
jgi:two-component system OmpR family response regulator